MKGSTVALYILTVVLLALALAGGLVLQRVEGAVPDVDVQDIYAGLMGLGLVLLVGQTVLVLRSLASRLRQRSREVAELTERLEQMRTIDDLTKAHNRRMLEEVLVRTVEQVRRYHTPMAGVLFDLDGFHDINVRQGYRSGDRLLVDLARRVRTQIRRSDMFFRWGGGTFIVLAWHADLAQAEVCARKLQDVVSGLGVEGPDGEGVQGLTASFAVTVLGEADTVDSFVGRLRRAVRSAKSAGRGSLNIVPPA
ncbi:MAG: GGDEF domain-containing protein [Desulfovibrionaceae bacterium]